MSRGKGRRRPPEEERHAEETPANSPDSTLQSKQRLLLLAFGLGFVALLVAFLVFQAADNPNPKTGRGSGVPDGFVATVHSPNGNVVNIGDAKFEHIVEGETGKPLKAVPQRGNKRLEDVQANVLAELLEEVWIREEAEALGVSVSAEEVAAELAHIKAKDYPTETAYRKFLEETLQTPEDVERQIRGQLLAIKVRETNIGPIPPGRDAQFTAARFELELGTRWQPRTQCAPGFLDLVGSGKLFGAGYVVETHCLGATNGKGALEEMKEQLKKLK